MKSPKILLGLLFCTSFLVTGYASDPENTVGCNSVFHRSGRLEFQLFKKNYGYGCGFVFNEKHCLLVKRTNLNQRIFKNPNNAVADTIKKSREKKSQYYIETDPSAFFFQGVSIIGRRSSTLLKNLTVGVGYYKVTLPQAWVNAHPDNKGKDWSAKLKNGVDVFLDYHIFNPDKGFSTGLILSMYNYEIRRNGLKSGYTSLIGTMRVGYMWRPFDKFFYVFPWVGLATGTNIVGETAIQGEKFVLKKWSIVPAVHIGASF